MALDRSVRSLEMLGRSASTARVLNLLHVWQEKGDEEEWANEPLFQNRNLNQTLIVKHRLRRDEYDAFPSKRRTATKVILPLDKSDLRAGGRALFVNQKHFEQIMLETFGLQPDHPDIRTLRVIDGLPSLDPFLLRECLRQAGIKAANCYFAISDADRERMTGFVQDEIRPLVELSLGQGGDSEASRKLVEKIMSDEPGDKMEAMRKVLNLTIENYAEGMFSWKGFLYYKWVLSSLMTEVASVSKAVATVRPVGKLDRNATEYLTRSREVLGRRITVTIERVMATLTIYDQAYAALTKESRPTAFRDFLLDAPALFARLGEQLGAVQHITSFWRFRFGPSAAPLSPEELIDILMDFETSLAESEDEMAAAGA
ncbi:MAG: hypothetical protein EON90_03550 [Brevundimonas sp.]|nr:MAG: hypothetical protein EON90_03550 [Brevundimonas sp.]